MEGPGVIPNPGIPKAMGVATGVWSHLDLLGVSPTVAAPEVDTVPTGVSSHLDLFFFGTKATSSRDAVLASSHSPPLPSFTTATASVISTSSLSGSITSHLLRLGVASRATASIIPAPSAMPSSFCFSIALLTLNSSLSKAESRIASP